MSKLKELKNSHVIWFCILVLLLERVLIKIPISIFDYFEIFSGHTNCDYLFSELIVLAVALILISLTGQMHTLRWSGKGFAKSLVSGLIFFALAVLGCIVFVDEGIAQGVAYKPLPEIIAFVAFVLTVGLAEEFLCRGIIADSILERYGTSKSGVIVSVVLSACLFGMSHIVNVFYGQSLEETIIQMIATSMMGTLLSAIYIKHKSVYGVAFLHALLNFMAMFMEGFWAGNTLQYVQQEINFWASLKQSLISQSVFIFAAIVVLRPSTLRKIIKEQGE